MKSLKKFTQGMSGAPLAPLAPLALLGALVLVFLLSARTPVALSQTPMAGWAWSDTIGWISLSGSNPSYGITEQQNGDITGFAWSDKIGWIKFGGFPADNFPSGPGTLQINARRSGNNLQGCARACAAAGDPYNCTGASTSGWDGWISLSGAGPDYGARTTSNPNYDQHYAWGSDVVGWLSFNFDASCTAAFFCSDADTSVYRDSYCTETVQTPDPCALGCNAGTGQCAVLQPPSGCISINAQTCVSPQKTFSVRKGGTVQIYWSASDADSCTVTGTNGQSWGPATSGLQTTAAIQQKTVYALSCTGDGGAMTHSATVNIIPEYREI